MKTKKKNKINVQPKAGDSVNHPPHYNQGNIEVIEFIEDQQLEYHEGNAVKYICRAPHKGRQAEDLKKAIWYLTRKLELVEAAAAGRSPRRPNEMPIGGRS